MRRASSLNSQRIDHIYQDPNVVHAIFKLHYQLYLLSNHLQWLSQGKPAGHQLWAFLDTP
jgi:hypothetical protein